MKNTKSFVVSSEKPLTEEEKVQLVEAVQKMLNEKDAEKAERNLQAIEEAYENEQYDRNLVPLPEVLDTEPLQSRVLDTPADNERLIEVVRRVPTTEPVREMQAMADSLIDHSYRLGYRDGVVDAYHNLEVRGVKVPTMTEMEIG
jgi:F0F1-type ATP synthase delta subunit